MIPHWADIARHAQSSGWPCWRPTACVKRATAWPIAFSSALVDSIHGDYRGKAT